MTAEPKKSVPVALVQPRKATMEKAYSEFATYAQDTLGAFAKANAVAIKGVETFSKNFFALASHALEEATEAGKRFSTVKSVTEAYDLSTKYTEQSYDTFVTESRKAQDLSAAFAKDVTAPFADRFKATVSTFAAYYPGVAPAPSTKKAA
jgi:phasin family protein